MRTIRYLAKMLWKSYRRPRQFKITMQRGKSRARDRQQHCDSGIEKDIQTYTQIAGQKEGNAVRLRKSDNHSDLLGAIEVLHHVAVPNLIPKGHDSLFLKLPSKNSGEHKTRTPCKTNHKIN